MKNVWCTGLAAVLTDVLYMANRRIMMNDYILQNELFTYNALDLDNFMKS